MTTNTIAPQTTKISLEANTSSWKTILENQRVMTRKERIKNTLHRLTLPFAAFASFVSALIVFG